MFYYVCAIEHSVGIGALQIWFIIIIRNATLLFHVH